MPIHLSRDSPKYKITPMPLLTGLLCPVSDNITFNKMALGKWLQQIITEEKLILLRNVYFFQIQ